MSFSIKSAKVTEDVSQLIDGSKMAYLFVLLGGEEYQIYLSKLNYVSVMQKIKGQDRRLSAGKTFRSWSTIAEDHSLFKELLPQIKAKAFALTSKAYGQPIILN